MKRLISLFMVLSLIPGTFVFAAPQAAADTDRISGIGMVSASSELVEDGKRYEAGYAVDGDLSTCWAEGADSYGVGEAITVEFDQKYEIKGLSFVSGWAASEELFRYNSRPKTLEVTFSEGDVFRIDLKDSSAVQNVNLPVTVKADRAEIVIMDVFAGDCKDTCISEIAFYTEERDSDAAVAVDLTYGTDPSEWTDIVQIGNRYWFTFGVKSDGTVLWHNTLGYYKKDSSESVNGYFAELADTCAGWTDIKRIVYCYGYGVFGIKNDGTLLCTGDGDFSAWTDIVDLVGGYGWTAGLKSDGTVVIKEESWQKDPAEDRVSSWRNIVALYRTPDTVSDLVGITEDGTFVSTISEYNLKFYKYLFTHTDIVKLHSSWSLGCFVGITKDGSVVYPEWMEEELEGDNIRDWTEIVDFASDYDGKLYGIRQDGTVVLTGNRCSPETLQKIHSWRNVVSLVADYNCVIGITADGSILCASGYKGLENSEITEWKNIKSVYYYEEGIVVGLCNDGTVKIAYVDLWAD